MSLIRIIENVIGCGFAIGILFIISKIADAIEERKRYPKAKEV